ncbi:hypothetical protein [Agromyces sp. NPDC058104]|uniref:hypothetical protein n=1 Tax=Agromyces sp. NPDC058104 TaxID=3346342 RepID=UPI0036D8B990
MTTKQVRGGNRGMVREALSTYPDAIGPVYRCRIIEAGMNLSGDTFYPPEVLERDKDILAPIDGSSYWNHPTWTEEWEVPGVRRGEAMAAKQVSVASWEAGEQALYADFEFNAADREYLQQFHGQIGMSIYAMSNYIIGTVGDFTGEIVTGFESHPLNSIDVVAIPGAGGAIVKRVSESLRRLISNDPATGRAAESSATPLESEGSDMTPEEMKALVAETVKAELATFAESIQASNTPAAPEGDEMVAGLELVAESGLPKAARTVAYEAVRAGTKAEDAIAAQKQFVESVREGFVPQNGAIPTTPQGGGTAVQSESVINAGPLQPGSGGDTDYAERLRVRREAHHGKAAR